MGHTTIYQGEVAARRARRTGRKARQIRAAAARWEAAARRVDPSTAKRLRKAAAAVLDAVTR